MYSMPENFMALSFHARAWGADSFLWSAIGSSESAFCYPGLGIGAAHEGQAVKYDSTFSLSLFHLEPD